MKIIIFIVCTLLLVANCQSCRFAMDFSYSLTIHNNTNHFFDALVVAENYNGYVKPYPDTILPESNRFVDKYNKERSLLAYDIKPNFWRIYSILEDWDKTIKKLPKDTLSIFIFHSDTLNKYSWEEVRDGYKILKRYDLSIQDLEKLDFNVPYPPSPEMSEMKMYPKYP